MWLDRPEDRAAADDKPQPAQRWAGHRDQVPRGGVGVILRVSGCEGLEDLDRTGFSGSSTWRASRGTLKTHQTHRPRLPLDNQLQNQDHALQHRPDGSVTTRITWISKTHESSNPPGAKGSKFARR